MLTDKKATAGHSEGGGAALTSASTVPFSNVTVIFKLFFQTIFAKFVKP